MLDCFRLLNVQSDAPPLISGIKMCGLKRIFQSEPKWFNYIKWIAVKFRHPWSIENESEENDFDHPLIFPRARSNLIQLHNKNVTASGIHLKD